MKINNFAKSFLENTVFLVINFIEIANINEI